MKENSTNTFNNGLIKDLHPLTTPNTILTNCLNGTLLTYNGNEYVLLNDMGNGKVGTAYLPQGYVPVGMVEHGGIIYVASHNPITHKSQIGSFPSPLQLFTGEHSDLIDISLNLSSMIKSFVGEAVPCIVEDYKKEPLMRDMVQSGESKPRTLHVGDKFVLKADGTKELLDMLKAAILEGFIELHLGVVNSEGYVDYIDSDSLRLENGLFFTNDARSVDDLLKDNSKIQVFNAKSSGQLVLITKLNTFDTFDLVRKYKLVEDNIIIDIYGKTTGLFEGNTNDSENVAIIKDLSSKGSSTILYILNASNPRIVDEQIYPLCKYGYLPRLAKSVSFDYDTIRKNSDNFSEFRYFIGENYLKIGWGYDYYNLSEEEDISKIVFTFMDVSKVDLASSYKTSTGDYQLEITKDYYSGSFEESIPLGDTIKRNWVYIVRIDRYVGKVSTTITYQLLYTSTFYNEYYPNRMFSDLELPVINLSVNINPTISVNKTGNRLYYKLAYEEESEPDWEEASKGKVSMSDVYKPAEEGEDYNYLYQLKREFDYDIEISPEVTIDSSFNNIKYAGVLPDNILNNFLSLSALLSKSDESSLEYNDSNSILVKYLKTDEGEAMPMTCSNGVYKASVTTSRKAIDSNGFPSTNVHSIERLEPIYSPNMSIAEKQQLIGFEENSSSITCVSAKKGLICYNTKITWGSPNTGSSILVGTETGGADDTSLLTAIRSMSTATINLVAGYGGDDASYNIDTNKRVSVPATGWYCGQGGGGELDNEDNWVSVAWKRTGGEYLLVNLASRKNEAKREHRVSFILRNLLSLMLVVLKRNITTMLVGPDPQGYVFHSKYPTTRTVIFTPNDPNSEDVDLMLGNVKVHDAIALWKSKMGQDGNSVVDYTPRFVLNKNDKYTTTISYGLDIDLSSDLAVIGVFTGTYSEKSEGTKITDLQRRTIYLADNPVSCDMGTGVITFGTDENGNYKVKSNTDRLYYPVSETSFNESVMAGFKNFFENKYAADGLTGEISEGFYNEVTIKDSVLRYISKWTNGHDNDAPDMAKGFRINQFSPYSL